MQVLQEQKPALGGSDATVQGSHTLLKLHPHPGSSAAASRRIALLPDALGAADSAATVPSATGNVMHVFTLTAAPTPASMLWVL